MIDFETLIKTVESLSGLLSEIQKDRFLRMEGLYREWNSKINVISRKDMDEFYSHHVFHSLCIAFYMKGKGGFPDGASILDLGTGGGFPGIPLAVMFPSCSFTLCDSIGKKVLVAGEVAAALGLENVVTVHDRVENLHRKFDFIVTRAVATLEDLYPWVKNQFDDSIICLKGGDIEAEISSFVRRCHVGRRLISYSPIGAYTKDEYFSEKFVIQIEKS